MIKMENTLKKSLLYIIFNYSSEDMYMARKLKLTHKDYAYISREYSGYKYDNNIYFSNKSELELFIKDIFISRLLFAK